MEPYVTTTIHKEKTVFAKVKGTWAQILNIRQLIEKGREYQRPLYFVSIL